MEASERSAFAVWITGLPASGKSTLSVVLKARLETRGVNVALLESDALRTVLTPHPSYEERERDVFYGQMVYIGALLVQHGVSVIFDATANRRRYRDRARNQIPQFLEVYVATSLETCMARDPKEIYRNRRNNRTQAVPGFGVVYEPPEAPDITVHENGESVEAAAARIVDKLAERNFIIGLTVGGVRQKTEASGSA